MRALFGLLFCYTLAIQWVIYGLVARCFGSQTNLCRYSKTFIFSNTNTNVNHFWIYIFRYVFTLSQGGLLFFLGSWKQKISFCPVSQHSSSESHLKQIKKTIAIATRRYFFFNSDACAGSELLELPNGGPWGVKAHQHSTNLRSWSSIPCQQCESMWGRLEMPYVSIKMCFKREAGIKVTGLKNIILRKSVIHMFAECNDFLFF